jgi:hypothetical protein
MRAGLVVLVLVGNAHATRLVVADGKSASLVEAGASSAKIVATIKLPSDVQQLVWIDRDPVVLLDKGAVGKLTEKGFVAIATPPSSAFTLAKPSEQVEQLDKPMFTLIGSTNDELWLGRCDWGFPADGHMICENWVYARLGVGAGVGVGVALTSRTSPPDGNPSWEGWPTVAPSPNVHITFAKRERDLNVTDDDAETMTCRYNGTTTTFPDGAMEWTNHNSLRWVSHDPPIFIINSIANGFSGIIEPTELDGCTVMGTGATGYLGPNDLFVLGTTLRLHDKVLLALPGASFVAFEPPPLPRANDAFAVLERELAGDTSMFAADAIVLSPTPTVGRPKLVKHARARIERFAKDSLGDATSLAAELVLDGKPYRTVQLIDANGRVVVATFAPVKSLAAGGAVPVMPSPTPAGPLAKLAASPASARSTYADTVVFGTELAEQAVGEGTHASDLLASWSKLALTLDPSVHEVDTASYGYAIASVALGKSRMIALVLGVQTKTGWLVTAIHYLGL